MRITKIDINNFRAFYGDYSIDLCKSGKNLLVYGENGSGKSSLFFALKLFLNSHVNNHDFSDYRNIFVETTDGGYLKLSLREDEYSKQTTYEWSDTIKETNNTLILDAAKTSGFVDYKGLLKTYFLTPEGNREYKEKQKELTTDDFWLPIKSFINKKDGSLYVDAVLAAEIELYRSIIMNPLSHSRIVTVIRKELQDAIGAVKRLETALK